MEKKFYENPSVDFYQMAVEEGYITTRDDNTGSFDGEWVPIGGK